MELKIGEYFFSWDRPVVMGILNLTPDSFYDGGRHNDINEVLSHCEKMINEGADIIDLGAFSTRLGMQIISDEEETERLLPSLIAIKNNFPKAIISIDTFRKNVAMNAIENGADIINDISGGTFDEEMLPWIGKNHIPYIMMHSGDSLERLHSDVIENDVCIELKSFFKKQTGKLSEYGGASVILDPGIGFNKSIKDNFKLLKNIEEYRINGLPVLIGISRKSMIYKTLKTTPQESLNGTTVLNTVAILSGADILRVHDVKQAMETIKLLKELD